MKKTQILLAAAVLMTTSVNVHAQLWGTGTEPTWTTGSAGVGTSTYLSASPTDSWMHIYGQPTTVPASCFTGGGGTVPGTTVGYVNPELWIERQSYCEPSTCFADNLPPNYFQIGNSGCGGPFSSPAVLLDVVNYQGWLGVLQPHPKAPLDVAGNGIIEKNLTVDQNLTVNQNAVVNINANVGNILTVGSNANVGGNLTVNGGQIDMTIPGDGSWRNINANSSFQGLSLSSGTGSSIGLRAGSSGDRPGTLDFVTTGPLTSSASPTGLGYYYYDGSTWNPLMRIWNDGKVTIGREIDAWVENTTNTPDGYRLYVSKGILTEKLKVALSATSNWSDFVFDKKYTLMPLAQVESYISANKHLPEVPSAEEVKASGIDVATMDAKLLQKIEELTLYVIQQQKEIEELKKANH